ncbi:FxsA family protein [Aliidiomarina taiwanensis]|nr:FxsA family protein [Aliidiomarina taiwanensis]
MFLLILFIIVPIIEISLLIEVGDAIGGFNTILLIILTAFVGAALVRRQGIRNLQAAQLKLAQGQPPGKEVLSGIMLFFAGVLFVTPGFFTDAVAVLLLFPPVQMAVGLWVVKKLQMRSVHTQTHFRQSFGQRERDHSNVFDAEYEEKTDIDGHISDDREKKD